MPELPNPPEFPPHQADERTTLTAFLDYYREVMLRKVSGVSDENLRKTMTDSNLTLLGILKHLSYVEQGWFRNTFEKEGAPEPWTDDDPDADFRVAPDESTESVVTLYRDQCERARKITERAASLDARAAEPSGSGTSLRWILVHMIEETARHAGHADLIRERIDGVVGD